MTKEYILESELAKRLDIAKANHYFVNGKDSKESEIERKVRNGSIVISQRQIKNILTYVSKEEEDLCSRIAKDFGITGSKKEASSEAEKILQALGRNKLVSYEKREKKYVLTKKGKSLKKGNGK